MDPRPRAVLFDFGGVIATSPFDAFRAYETSASLPLGFLQRLNSRDPDTNAWARMERGELGEAEFFGELEAEARALGATIDARALFARLAVRVRSEMVTALRALKAYGYRLACVTNNMRLGHGVAMSTTAAVAAEIDAALAHFDHVVESCKIGARKPELRFFEHACERVGVLPEECVYLDDLGINLKPARVMGMRTIKVTDPKSALAELESALGHSLEDGPSVRP